MTDNVKKIIEILDKAVVFDTKVYDMTSLTPFYDFSIIASVKNSRQGNAAVDYLRKDAPLNGFTIRSISGHSDSRWFLVDLNDIVVHIFVGDERDRYNLDGLYSHNFR
ncbi:MAG TPA: ribosome silencing factor [Bacilli bacterium]|jgi:ribosome-associated protein|nr:ribosome silencing factor [Acholeplasmataceae bacterium]OQB62612.1 MAG: Ribosomal silencing factor RsfS [Tenericutes bacterium ADurb.Bin140]HOE77363.1 ribosome silencing factor [Bacilli bacterium]HON63761.1 ribosome silencing factor [Bacilli bacterium]HOR95637.1 ribosome silencing factor [Bacilli bacterium]